jgi:ribose 5-phosphate isomerase B
MRISVAADELTGIAQPLVEELRQRGHEPLLHGAYVEDERPDWAWAAESAARDVADGRADQAIVLCWTGTGASIAANKVPGIRAALCTDARTVEGARRWNDANVLALSLRRTGLAELQEMLDAWFSEEASADPQDVENIAHLSDIEAGAQPAAAVQPKVETAAVAASAEPAPPASEAKAGAKPVRQTRAKRPTKR